MLFRCHSCLRKFVSPHAGLSHEDADLKALLASCETDLFLGINFDALQQVSEDLQGNVTCGLVSSLGRLSP